MTAWPEFQHELGVARVYYVTKKYWDVSIKNDVRQMICADLKFDVQDEIVKANETMRLPDEIMV